MERLAQFVQKEKLASGMISGIGAFMNSQIGFYDLKEKKYLRHIVEEECELVSLTGNISWFEDKPIVHCHVSLGTPDFKLLGGHLFEAEVAVTCEVWILPSETKAVRKFSECVGLNLLS